MRRCHDLLRNFRMLLDETTTNDEPRQPGADGRVERSVDSAKQKEKQKAFLALVILVTGTLIIGILLILLVVLWGSRLRRQLRHSADSKTRTIGSDFWFLKPKAMLKDEVSPNDAAPHASDDPPNLLPPPEPK